MLICARRIEARRGPRAHTNANIIDCRRDKQYPRSCFSPVLFIIYLVFTCGSNGQDTYNSCDNKERYAYY